MLIYAVGDYTTNTRLRLRPSLPLVHCLLSFYYLSDECADSRIKKLHEVLCGRALP